MKKRWLALLLLLAMAVTLAACGGSSDQGGVPEETGKNNEALEIEPPSEVVYTGDGTLMADVPYLEHPILGDGGEAANSRHATRYFTITKGGTAFRIPDYYGELESKRGDDNLHAPVTSYYAATGENLGMIEITGFDASESKLKDYDLYDAHYIIFERKREDLTAMENLRDLQEGDVTMFLLNNGMFAVTKRYTYNLSGVDCEHILTAINNPRARTLMYVELIQAAGAEYDYIADYEQVVLTADLAKE
ncbi:MAG: hypothetical protein IJH91_00885 [Mogibacterium sp.]|nr:hypothetical protein [Mogibacterium sp.]